MPQEKDIKQTILGIVSEAKQYLGLQKQYIRLTAAEKLTLLVSRLVLLLVFGLVGFVVFIFASLALVMYAGSLTGNLALSFGIYSLLLVFGLWILWLKRRSWIVLPIARMFSDILLAPEDSEEPNTDTSQS